MIYVQSRNVDLLSRNHIQRDTQKLLFPLILMQYLILCPKYCIRYNFITSNGFVTNIAISVYVTVVIITYSYSFINYIKQFPLSVNHLAFFILTFQHLLFCVGLAYNTLVALLHSQINVELLINLQIIRSNITVNKKIDRKVLFGNWLCIAMVVLFYLLNWGIQSTWAFTTHYTIILFMIIVVPLDFNIVYIALIIKMLKEEISCWISELKFISYDTTVTEDDTQTRWNAILNAYFAIIEAYNICQKIIGTPIIYYMFMTFLQCIINVQILIEFDGMNVILVLCIMWSAKNALILAVICYYCESVYITLKNAQVACVMIPRQEYWSEKVITMWKKLRLEGKKKRLPMNANGLFWVNAVLPLQLFSVLATYTIVLLQFNFL